MANHPRRDVLAIQALGLAGAGVATVALFCSEPPPPTPLPPLSTLSEQRRDHLDLAGEPNAYRGLPTHTGLSAQPGPDSGHLRFAFKTGGAITGRVAVDRDGNLYVASHDGWLYSLTADGQLRFRRQLNGSSFGGPIVTSDQLVVVGTDAGLLHGLDAGGNPRFSYQAPGPIDSPPTGRAHRGLLLGAGPWVVALARPTRDTAPKTLWRTKADGRVFASPAQGPKAVYATAQDHRLYALDSGTGRVLFQREFPRDLDVPPIVGDATVYAAGDGGTVAGVSVLTGEIRFEVHVDGDVRGPMALGRGALWLQTTGSRPALLALDPDSGAVLAGHRFPLADPTDAVGRSGPVVDALGRVYVGGSDGAVYGFDADGSLLFRFPTDGELHAPPVLANDGTLYIGSTDGVLYALGAPPAPRIVPH